MKKLKLTTEQSAALDNGFRNGVSYCFRMHCHAVFLKGKGLFSVEAGQQTEMSCVSVIYVPYGGRGGQFRGEAGYIGSGRTARVNIFGMIDRQNNYKGFTTTDSMNVDKVIEFLDDFSFQVHKNTFVRLDNATVHCNHKIKELRPI